MENIAREDAIFFWDMLNSPRSPNCKPQLGRTKQYYKILKDTNSNQYKRFIGVYKEVRYLLSERELYILDEVYGFNENKECRTLKSIGESLNITMQRVRQIRVEAEYKFSRKMLRD